MSCPPPPPNPRHDTLAGLLLALMLAFMLYGFNDLSPTVDEPFHLVRGLAWWWSDSTALSFAHPPLANLVMSAPAAWSGPPVDFSTLKGWESQDHMLVAEALLKGDYPQWRSWLVQARWMSMALTLAFAIYSYLWSSRRFGTRIGLGVLALLVFNPSLLAHGRLVTTDLPVIASYFVSVTAFVSYLQPRATPKTRQLLWFAVAFAACLTIKFTSLVLIPYFGLVGLLWAWKGWGRFQSQARWSRLARVSREVLVVGLVSWFAVNAVYRFENTGMSISELTAHPEPQCYLTRRSKQEFLEKAGLNRLPASLRLPLPYTYIFGCVMVASQSNTPHPSYFMGAANKRGATLYFPTLFLLKTPPLLLLGLLLWARPRRPKRPDLMVLGGAGLWLMLMLMRSSLNVGVRHILPVVPLWSVLATVGLEAFFLQKKGRWRREILGLLSLTLPLGLLAANGHYLSWFNIGSIGHQVSIVGEDWGQDTAVAGRRALEEGWSPVYYTPYGPASMEELRHTGLNVRRRLCTQSMRREGWYLVHRATYARQRSCGLPREPDAVINEHILVWKVERP